MSKRKPYRRSNGPPFVQLYRHLIDSRAWHLLSFQARAGYIEVARRYDGKNNGRISMSSRDLAGQLPCNKDTALKVLGDLEDAGFIELVKIGKFACKKEIRLASEYRLTCFRCDVTGEPPSRKFDPNVRWERHPHAERPSKRPMTAAERQRRCREHKRHESHGERPTKPDGSVRPNRTPPVTVTPSVRPNRTVKPKCHAPSVRQNRTHIYLHHGGCVLAARGDRASAVPYAQCPKAKPDPTALPPGWYWCKFEKRVVTADGTIVPIVNSPLVGTAKERAAFHELRRWEALRRKRGAPKARPLVTQTEKREST